MWKSVIATVVVLVFSIQCAWAQRDEPPRIPLPISVVELTRYGDILNLSEDQRLAIEAEYDAYLDDFAPLRREMIDAAVANPGDKWERDPFIALLPEFTARAQAIDGAFFTRMAPMLAEAQLKRMQRVRMLRERTMLCSIQALNRFIGDGLPQMRELLESLDPPPESLLALAPALDDYERRCTISVKQAFDAATRLCAAESNDQAIDRLVDAVRSQRAMNRRLLEDFGPSLPEDVRTAWWQEFLARAYGHANQIADVVVIARINAALSSDLTDAERAALEALRTQAIAYESQARGKMLDLHDRYAISRAPPRGAVADPEYYEGVNAMQREVMMQDDEFRKSLDGILGTERVKALKPDRGRFIPSTGGQRAACGVRANVCRVYSPEESRGVPAARSDPLIPAPLSIDDVEIITTSLNLQPQQAEMIRNRYRALANEMAQAIEPMRDSLFGSSLSIRPPKDATNDPMKWAKSCDQAREKLRAAIKIADAELQVQILEMLPEPVDDSMWQRIVRLHDRAHVTLDLALSSGANHSGELDLMRLLLLTGLNADAWAAIEPITTPYEMQLSARLTTLFNDYRDNAVMETAQRAGWRGEGARDWSERMEHLHKQHQALAQLNCETVDQLVAALPQNAATTLRESFNRAAFALAFVDRASVEAPLARAASLADITNSQRERIGELRAAFDGAISGNQQELVRVCAAFKPDLPAIGWTDTPEREANHERFALESGLLLDERSQINRRALRGLRMTLTPAQFQQVQAQRPE